MPVYQRGTPINIVVEFQTIDPLTSAPTPTDPTTVAFVVSDPAGAETTYTFGVSLAVTNPAVGTFVCALPAQELTGTYRWRAEGTGAAAAQQEGTFDVLASGVLPPDAPTTPIPGPCTPWISGSDVIGCPANVTPEDAYLWDTAAQEASAVLFELSGRLYPGVCTRTVRPCTERCNHWGGLGGGGPWVWSMSSWGYGYGGAWRDDRGNACGCSPLSEVPLAGYPVREIVEVKIDGQVLDPSGYRLDGWRKLVRLDDPGPPVVTQRWPGCQNLALSDDQPGTFSVKYRHGQEPPVLARDAAAQLAGELYKACTSGECALPTRVTRIVRQGITIERLTALAQMLRTGATGLQMVDAFVASSNPGRISRRPAVWSPDVQSFARRVG